MTDGYCAVRDVRTDRAVRRIPLVGAPLWSASQAECVRSMHEYHSDPADRTEAVRTVEDALQEGRQEETLIDQVEVPTGPA